MSAYTLAHLLPIAKQEIEEQEKLNEVQPNAYELTDTTYNYQLSKL